MKRTMFKIPIKEGTERCFVKQSVQEDKEEKEVDLIKTARPPTSQKDRFIIMALAKIIEKEKPNLTPEEIAEETITLWASKNQYKGWQLE